MRILGQLFAFAPHISMGQVNKLIFHIFFGPTLQRSHVLVCVLCGFQRVKLGT